MKNEPVTPIERYSIATKPWQTTKDIEKFTGCCASKACALMKEMHDMVINSGKKPMKGHISKAVFHEYFEINIEALTKEAKDWATIQNILKESL